MAPRPKRSTSRTRLNRVPETSGQLVETILSTNVLWLPAWAGSPVSLLDGGYAWQQPNRFLTGLELAVQPGRGRRHDAG
jgi:hypothetical protein